MQQIQFPGKDWRDVSDEELDAIYEKVERYSGRAICDVCGKILYDHPKLKIRKDDAYSPLDYYCVVVTCYGDYGHL